MLTGYCYNMAHPRSVCPRARCPECTHAAGYAAGQRDMLWRMAVGASVRLWQHGHCPRLYPDSITMFAVDLARAYALETLESLGDEQARALLAEPHL